VVLLPFGLGGWHLSIVVLVNAAAAIGAYLLAVHRLSGVTGPAARWSPARSASFVTGVLLVAATATGPLDGWAHALFWPHMMGHLLLMMVAAPLIVLGSPVRLLFLSLPPDGRRRMVRILRSAPLRLLITPWVGWLLLAGVLIGTHIPVVMTWLLTDHDAMDVIERPLYLIAALIYYYPLIGDDLIVRRPPPTVRLASLGLMMIPQTALGIVIHLSPVVLYRPYAEAAAVLGTDALTDQKFAGALMWALAMVLDGFWMMLAAVDWWREQERLTARLERTGLPAEVDTP